jgi:iron complex transport system substrate-binding protein
MLVAVDDHSDYPEAIVEGMDRIGPDLDIDVDRIRNLEPDLVIASNTVPGHEHGVQRLVESGLPHIVTAPKPLPDVAKDIREIAAALGVEQRGDALAVEFEAAFEPREHRADRRPRILVEWWPKPVIVPGYQSWVTGMIELAGGINPMADRQVESAPVETADVLQWQPDAIVMSWCGVPLKNYRADVVRRRTDWASIPAFKGDRIYAISEALLGRPGPRLIEGLSALERVVDDCLCDRAAERN